MAKLRCGKDLNQNRGEKTRYLATERKSADKKMTKLYAEARGMKRLGSGLIARTG